MVLRIANALNGGEVHEVKLWSNGFQAKDLIGKGRFGVVYRCTIPKEYIDAAGVRQLAVKKLVVSGSVTMRDVAKNLSREVHILSQFRHPNIIKLAGYCSKPEEICLLFELGVNGDLKEALKNDVKARFLTLDFRLKIAIGVARALNYLHCHNPNQPVFHRDVKSANIVLMADYTPRLIDCGLAKYEMVANEVAMVDLSYSTTGDRVFGTPGYTCQTYQQFGVYDTKAEIFSLGIVLLELFTGIVTDPGKRIFLHNEYETKKGLKQEITMDSRCSFYGDQRHLAEAQRRYLELCGRSIVTHGLRVADMVTVVRELTELLRSTSGNSYEHAERENRKLRRAFEGEQRTRLRSRQRLEEEAKRNRRKCLVCYDPEVDVSTGLECKSNAKHFLCQTCIESMVESQVSDQNKANITCCICIPGTNYPDKDIARMVSDGVWTKLSKLKENLIRADEQRNFESWKADYIRQHGAGASVQADRLAIHFKHITEDILNIHCQNENCGAVIYDFDGCFAVECQLCGHNFCGWCLTDCVEDAHPHVMHCPLNTLHRGSYCGTIEEFNQVHTARRKKEVEKYIQLQVPNGDQQLLRENIKPILAQLGIVL